MLSFDAKLIDRCYDARDLKNPVESTFLIVKLKQERDIDDEEAEQDCVRQKDSPEDFWSCLIPNFCDDDLQSLVAKEFLVFNFLHKHTEGSYTFSLKKEI